MTGWRRWTTTVAGCALAGTIAAAVPVSAQQPPTDVQVQAQAPAQAPPAEEPARPRGDATQGPAVTPVTPSDEKSPNTGRFGVVMGVDWASAYYFRGIANEQNGGNNVQPWGEIGFRLLENMGPLTSLSLGAGFWNNWHYGGGTLVEASDPQFWYEADIYVKLSTTWWESLTAGVTYTYYTSPNGGFTSYSDVGLFANLNDSKWLGAFALNPSLIFAFETKGEALVADDKKGIYMGISFAPGYTFLEDSKFPLNISLPMTFGFSLKDYYTVNGVNQTFGYFSGGPLLTVPLKMIPAAYGSWALKAGVQFLALNSNLKAVNTNQGFVPIGTVGLSLTY
jgi:hypothetical protein